MPNKRLCFACDLKDNPSLMEEYRKYHAPGNVWPEVVTSIREAGILNLDIFQIGNRLFMIMEVVEDFVLAKKALMDGENPKVQDWEALMWKYQQAVPWAKEGEKWTPMEQIFNLKDHE